MFVIGLCLLGIVICYYAMKVESKDMMSPKFLKICGNGDSCSLVLSSKYAHLMKLIFNLPENSPFNCSNAHYGLFYYCFLCLFQFYPLTLLPFYNQVFFTLTLFSVLGSCVLAWILYSILHTFCRVCFSIYIVNTLLFISAIIRLI